MKVKTSKAEGEVLNYLVAKAMGKTVYQSKSKRLMTAKYGEFNHRHGAPWFSPSTDWAQAGPIIDREKITLDHLYGAGDAGADVWVSTMYLAESEGPTPLVAAMRCYVASKLGDEVEVPNEIVS
jgi:hypothetical protein